MNIGNDEPVLDEVLRQWSVKEPLPPGFQENVWQRIARAETRSQTQARPWAVFQRLVEAVLPRPQFAFAYVTAFFLLGIAGGSMLAQRNSSRLELELGLRYMQSVDPYRAELPGSNPR